MAADSKTDTSPQVHQDAAESWHKPPADFTGVRRLREDMMDRGRVSMDGWSNSTTGLGDANRDKRSGGSFYRNQFSYWFRREFYRADPTAAKIVDRPAEEMFREGWQVKVAGDAEAQKAVEKALEELQVREKFEQAVRWARAYGGGPVYVGVDDGGRPDSPLRMDRIKSVDFITPYQPIECSARTYFTDPFEKRFGEVATYQLFPQLAQPLTNSPFRLVDESRILRFEGITVARDQLVQNYGWGDSVLDRLYETVRDFVTVWDSSAAIVQDFNQPIFQLEGLADVLAADDGTQQLIRRLTAMDLARSIVRALVIDKDETFSKVTTNVAGLADILELWCKRLAMDADMPVALLMGDSPSGLNATGEAETTWFYDRIRNLQRTTVLRPLNQLVKMLFLAKEGPTKGKEPESWSVVFNPLWQQSDEEKSKIRLNIAQADALNIANGVYSGEEAAESHYGGDEFNVDVQLDRDLREGMEESLQRANESTLGEEDPEEALARQVALKTAQPPEGDEPPKKE
jgi:phage-related protein (TIGR01555 family)